ncbi:class I SAM-dependent methyltransferase [Verminephrobacter eiseniae]|uniref:Methyltransferase type 11 n=1 Tax=Verminephrobacter eiseniae (strain EF01-2) TaxID=391735 RepID=A1WFL0_VEREI|nr:class I SAM-dependent methyltransferase [Verminephrobacter eiseniae]ABM56417.1 Methyltransferase type 11 [Verminephrobacter eiseniae EF01-2]MCW5233469.1 class I SAM-dependent methyltransferase [Verminephrobacter eiseniae]MCW5235077.1 class I SAM-dependent methyltransferase [Verminephrobacter eiseniae]MCW5261622.1 class I SAM-dependent methyltransferase [Verminephrobacter eiseniae]MCW5286780.1 class I SAM-dependent methyltransferase [Verminephrobacter eiseniae]
MHLSSLEHVEQLVGRYLQGLDALTVIDVGSYDVNGSYRPFFSRPGWRYTGVDLTAGPNVDRVMTSPYRLPFASHSVDVIVSGQAFEHVQFFWLTWLEMVRVLKPGGHILLLAPSRGPEHRYPQDCWRFYPDAYRALAAYGDLELLEVSTDWNAHADPDSAPWGDTVGVFRQRPMSALTRLRRRAMQRLRHWLLPGYRA